MFIRCRRMKGKLTGWCIWKTLEYLLLHYSRKKLLITLNVFACRPDFQRKEPTWHNFVQWYTPPIPSSQVCPSTTSCDDHCGGEWCWWTTKSWWFEHRTNSHELILADTIRWDQSYHADGCLDFNLTGKTLCWFPPQKTGDTDGY